MRRPTFNVIVSALICAASVAFLIVMAHTLL